MIGWCVGIAGDEGHILAPRLQPPDLAQADVSQPAIIVFGS